ncbi:glycosyltransferase family 2 protein [Rhodovulum sp. DZ06]|uniref:glycosyltransferase family 2 protein n=1 Tax=Rhodovulum sp. DZ06 TaxID=3425126 RepID=UPI003D33FDB0
MKLIIQIPCHNEEAQLPETLGDLPREVDGFDTVEWLIIDDGSTDRTVEVAREHGADHVLSLGHNHGLAAAFMAGIERALRLGADVIVNTDGDNQYRADCIPALCRPILEGRAQIAVGARPIAAIAHFSPLKRFLQKLGSRVVRLASGADVEDAPSGFRAIHRNAAARLYVFNRWTYTLETIIQAGQLRIPTVSVPIEVNPPTRPSRLFRSTAQYVLRSAFTILRIATVYRPARTFGVLGALTMLPGLAAFARFLVYALGGDPEGKLQSLVIGSGLIAAGAAVIVGGMLADLVAANRMLLSEIRARQLLADIERERGREG